MKSNKIITALLLTIIVLNSCKYEQHSDEPIVTDENGVAILSDSVVENIVRRSYQYVALYNVNNKWAMGPQDGLGTGGWNKGLKKTELLDHNTRSISRPNNDNLYQVAMLDLQHDAIVFKFPAIDSKYVSLMATAYDHYVNIPLSTTKGDFSEPTTVLFYSQRTKGYKGEPVEGVDEIFEMSGDFVSLAMRVMPHAQEPERYAKIVDQINAIGGMSLSKFKGGEDPEIAETIFPEYGETDLDIFENNLLEVMQFVFNHLTFDPNDDLDKSLLAAYQPLGIEPGKAFDPNGLKIDGDQFRRIADQVRLESLGMMTAENAARLGPKLFMPKGKTNLEAITAVSVIGPIGQPMTEAMYPPINTLDGSIMNAQYDYVIRMTKDELPPAKAFWSITLYDRANGFFIPNDHKKYSVGENAGFKLNEEGGIEIYISAEKPEGVPMENWLPINRMDQDIDLSMRIYAPDLEKVKTWKPPLAEKL
jgi:hypothetical protein